MWDSLSLSYCIFRKKINEYLIWQDQLHKDNIEKLLGEPIPGQPISLDEMERAQVFKQDIMERLRSGKIDSDELEILLPVITSRVLGKTPIVGVRRIMTCTLSNHFWKVYNEKEEERLNFVSAVERQIVRDSFARDLLEAQAACGTILNVETG